MSVRPRTSLGVDFSIRALVRSGRLRFSRDASARFGVSTWVEDRDLPVGHSDFYFRPQIAEGLVRDGFARWDPTRSIDLVPTERAASFGVEIGMVEQSEADACVGRIQRGVDPRAIEVDRE